jgi:hypothetical protein
MSKPKLIFGDRKEVNNIENGNTIHQNKNNEPPLVAVTSGGPECPSLPWKNPEHNKDKYDELIL